MRQAQQAHHQAKHCRIRLLLVYCGFDRRARFSDAIFRWRLVSYKHTSPAQIPRLIGGSLPLGFHHGRKTRESLRLLCWMVEFFRLDLWCSLDHGHSCRTGAFDVFAIPPCLCAPKVACLRGLYHIYVDLLRYRIVRKSGAPGD